MGIQKNDRLKDSRLSSGTTGNRTRDTRIFSPLLYQLSYGTICEKIGRDLNVVQRYAIFSNLQTFRKKSAREISRAPVARSFRPYSTLFWFASPISGLAITTERGSWKRMPMLAVVSQAAG